MPTDEQLLTRAHVAGTHRRLGRSELRALARRYEHGDSQLRLGLPDEFIVPALDVHAALGEMWGCTERNGSVTIDPKRTLGGLEAMLERLDDVSGRSGRVMVATARPASLLGLHLALARRARCLGAEVLENARSGEFRVDGRRGRRIWWIGGVAVVTDGAELLAVRGTQAGDEWLFHLPRPDLVVADGPFAGMAVREGHETLAFADLDDFALGVAAAAGRPVTLVPLDTVRPPASYAPLLARIEAGAEPRDAAESRA